MSDPRATRRPSPSIVVVLMVAITIVLAAVLYSSVGGCAYSGPSLRSTFADRNVSAPDLAAAIEIWNRSTRVTLHGGYANAVSFDCACVDRTGHGWVELAPVGGGPNSTVAVFVYANSEHPRGYSWFDDPFGPSVDDVFERDRAHVGPCFDELTAILSASLGGSEDVSSWGRFGLC